MKAAMWALGMLVLSIFGVVLVNLFGNITVTDQLNYTTMKNTVEASMLDALDLAHFRAGFCLCTNKDKVNGKWSFADDTEYELTDIVYEEGTAKCSLKGYHNCETIYGEYRIKPKIFTESLTRRFVEMVNNSKDYEIIIQDIIEYPPKVSIRVVSKDEEYSPTEKDSGGYEITNQIDAIIEADKVVVTVISPDYFPPTPTPTPSPTPTPTTKPVVKYTCNFNYDEKNNTLTITGSASDGTKVKSSSIDGVATTSITPTTSKTYSGVVYFADGKSATCSKTIKITPSATPSPTPTVAPTIAPTPASYVITEDSKFSGYRNIASCNSNTLKYRIISYNNQDIVLVWVANPTTQLNSALASDKGDKSAAAETILSNEISTYGYSNKCMFAVNASFFDMGTGNLRAAVIISKGVIVRNDAGGAAGVIGVNGSGYLQEYNAAYSATDLINNGVRSTFRISAPTHADDSAAVANRTQICQIDRNNFAILSGSGKVKETGETLKGLVGCSVAYNLDGGGSRKLYYKNQSSGTMKQQFGGGRKIPDMLYFVEQ